MQRADSHLAFSPFFYTALTVRFIFAGDFFSISITICSYGISSHSKPFPLKPAVYPLFLSNIPISLSITAPCVMAAFPNFCPILSTVSSIFLTFPLSSLAPEANTSICSATESESMRFVAVTVIILMGRVSDHSSRSILYAVSANHTRVASPPHQPSSELFPYRHG